MLKTILSALALLATLSLASPARAAVAQIDLGPAILAPGSASFEVSLLFTGPPGDNIQAIQLALGGSSPALTANGTDFGRFSFTPDASTLPAWIELLPVSTGVGLYAPDDPIAGPFLAPALAPQRLGTLSVSLAGLPAGAALRVSLAGGDPGLVTDLGGVTGGDFVTSFADAAGLNLLTLGQPDGVGFTTPAVIPEPASAGLALLAAVGILLARRTAWH